MKQLKFLLCFAVLTIAQSVSADTVIPGGAVSGMWVTANSPFVIGGDIYVDAADSLIIEPGVIVRFEGWYKVDVYGILKALGTAADSVTFTCDTAAIQERWGGLRFSEGSSASRLEYSVIEYARASDYWRPYEETKGGGLYFSTSSPVVSHCSIRHNIAPTYYGGGMSATYGASPVFTACDFVDNHAQYGGAVNLEQSADPVFNDCDFIGNSATLNADEFYGGGGGAVNMVFYAAPQFNRCVFAGNSAF
ncbi:MAG: hypothetical protein IPG71_01430 [bacterium]|nr:hypothetical protein [bacterium]